MGVQLNYSLSQVNITPNDLISYDKREKRGDVSVILARSVTETNISPATSSIPFSSHEIRRAVDLYAEEFCLHVEDILKAFWGARQGLTGLGLPIWLQTSSSSYTNPAIEGAMGEAVTGYIMERVYRASLHHRPRGRAPDIYMILPNGQGATVEAKATINLRADALDTKIGEALTELLTIWAHIDSVQKLEELAGFCVAVGLGADIVACKVLRLEYVP
jgi:hypothetical protein